MAKINRFFVPVLSLLGAAAWFQPAVAGSDLFWHLASGREIWRRGSPLLVDPFSFTFGGRKWMNHEWLWDVLVYGLYWLNPELVAWGQLSVATLAFGLAFLVALRSTGSPAAAGIAVVAAAAASHWFIDLRPHVVTLLLVGIVLVKRERRYAPWLWPILVVFWANLHGGFVYGLGAIGLLALVGTVRESVAAGSVRVPALPWIGVALALAAMLANPFGYRILEYPLAYLDAASPYRRLIEWRPPPFSLDPRGFAGRFVWLSALALPGALRLARRDPYLVLLAAITFLMAATSRRFIPLFALVSTPLAAATLGWVSAKSASFWPALVRPASLRIGAAVAVLLCGWLWKDVRLLPRLLDRWTQADLYPHAAVAFLNALGPPERVLNHYNWGGFLMLHAPGAKVFIDGRANTLYDETIFLDYQLFLAGDSRAIPRLARYRADAAILPPGAFAKLLLSLRDPWHRIYDDGEAVVLVPSDSPLRYRTPLLPEQNLPDLRVGRAERATARGDFAEARRELETALRVDPFHVRGWGALALLEAAEGRPDQIALVIARAVDVDPRRAKDLRIYEGGAYLRAGDPRAALRAYRAALLRGPFGSPDAQQEIIDALERKLREQPAQTRAP
jgi:hypothetical protein